MDRDCSPILDSKTSSSLVDIKMMNREIAAAEAAEEVVRRSMTLLHLSRWFETWERSVLHISECIYVDGRMYAHALLHAHFQLPIPHHFHRHGRREC